MFKKEADGINLLYNTNTVPVPKVIGSGEIKGIGYFLMDFIHEGVSSHNTWVNFAENLFHLHQVSNFAFGLDYNNYIGTLTQENEYHEDWVGFFIEKRLYPQFRIALDNLKLTLTHEQKFSKLCDKIPSILTNDKPSLLHGDLWSGNVMVNQSSEVAIYDPAIYFGHHEMEIAYTRLFGTFREEFYTTYFSLANTPKGFYEREQVYNLYPMLVHLNLFGEGYLPGVEYVFNQFE